MVSLGTWTNGIGVIAPAAALGAVALALALARMAFWARHFARRNPAQRDLVARGTLEAGSKLPPSCDPLAEIEWAARSGAPERARLLAGDLVSAASRGQVLLDGVASLAALLGLVETFLTLRGLSPGQPPGAARLTWALSGALSGLGVFAGARTVLALFHAWESALRLDVALALQSPAAAPAPVPAEHRVLWAEPAPASGGSLDDLLWSVPAPAARRPRRRRAWSPPARESGFGGFRGAAVFASCLIGSVLCHLGIFYLARHLDSAASRAKPGEGEGVFLASLVPVRREVEPVRAEPPRVPEPAVLPEVPPPPPHPPPPPPPEAKEPPPPPEVPEAKEKEAPTETAKAPPVEKPAPPEAEKPPAPMEKEATAPVEKEAKPAAPPGPPPAAPPAARDSETAPEPPAPAAPKVKESAAQTPEPPAPTRFTEASKGPVKAPEPAVEDPAPAPRAPAPPGPAPAASAPSPAALGFGGNPPEKAAGSADSDSKLGGSEISTVRDYQRFLAKEMKAGAREGQYVPNLRFGDNKAQENREIMRYFGMELIAYPKNQKFYVYIDPEQGLYSRSNDFSYIHNFSSRVIFRNSPYFDALRAEAAKRVGVETSTLVMAQLLKQSSAAYIGWKERESARRAGVALEDVEACDASFAKTPFGVWIVRIDRLLMRDGRTIAVQDFEWGKVSGG